MGKQKRATSDERRRPLAEINLAGDSKQRRTAGTRRGCLGLFGALVLTVGGAALLAVLH